MHLCVNCVKSCLFCIAEVATGKLLDLAEGANMALVHSGTKQTESDPFMVHNHATENNNTVWVRQESGLVSEFQLFRLDMMYCTCCIQRSGFYSDAATTLS